MWWQSCFPVINGKDTTASPNECYLYGNFSIWFFFYDLQPCLNSSQGTLGSLTERKAYEDINNSIRRNLWPNLWWWIAKYQFLESMSQTWNGCGRKKWFRNINPTIWHGVQPACLCASSTEGIVRSFSSAHQAGKNHVLIEKLCYLMLWIYKGDE